MYPVSMKTVKGLLKQNFKENGLEINSEGPFFV